MAEYIYIFVMVYQQRYAIAQYAALQVSPEGLVRAVEWEVSSTLGVAPDCTLANYLAELFPTRNYSDYSAPLQVIGFTGTESRMTDVRSPTGREIYR